jgi:hypothetical protein
MKSTRLGFMLVAVFLGPSFLHAEEGASLISQADAAYAKREDLPEAKIALITYERAAAALSSSTTAGLVECDWKASRAAYWLGDHEKDRSERMTYFSSGIALAQKAIAINPDSVEAHFWLGCNEGSYGDTKGVLKSLSLIKPIRHEMAEVIRLNDRYSNGGAYQVLGVVDYKVPGLMGGSKTRAKQELEKALSIGPNDPFNHYYMAEYDKTIGEDSKAKAEIDILRTLTVEPDQVPELKMLQERAKSFYPQS